MLPELNEFIKETAKLCHEANRAYCRLLGDDSQVPWEEAPDWQKESAIKGVYYHLENPNSTPRDSHNSWKKEKVATGWIYGKEKDPIAKTHPCMVPYEELPIDQKIKDYIFWSIIQGRKEMAV